MNPGRGVVYLVGAGPGDPGLLTRRGAEVLGRADVVVYDHLASSRLLDLARASALRICAGKSSGHCTLNQDQINQLLLEHASSGRAVVRLKGGDPLVFGRGAEEAEFLVRHGIAFEIVPGVTAGVGATAYAGIPVTHRGAASAVAFVTGHADPEAELPEQAGQPRIDWPALARFPGTLVVYMGVTHLAAICRTLIKQGKPAGTPAAVIESGTLASQRVVQGTLETIAGEAGRAMVRPPALLVIGNVVGAKVRTGLVRVAPLVRPADRGHPADRRGGTLGGIAGISGGRGAAGPDRRDPARSPIPARSTVPSTDLRDFDWLVFTSSNGVRFFVERMLERGLDVRALGHLKIAAIGPGTAQALARYHLLADLVPDTFRSEALAEALAARASGCRILLARADRGRVRAQGRAGQGGPGRSGGRLPQCRLGIAAGSRGRANRERNGRLDHAYQLGHHRAVARTLAGACAAADRA